MKLLQRLVRHRVSLMLAGAVFLAAVALLLVVASSGGGPQALPSVVTAPDGVTATSGFCVQAKATMNAMEQNDLSISATQEKNPRSDPTKLVLSDLDSLRANVSKLAAVSPKDIATYFQPIESALGKARSAAKQSLGKPMQAANSAMQSLRFPEKVITAYVLHHCGFTFQIGTSPSSTTTVKVP